MPINEAIEKQVEAIITQASRMNMVHHDNAKLMGHTFDLASMNHTLRSMIVKRDQGEKEWVI